MAKRVVPKRKLPLHIEDWMRVRGMSRKQLADALDTTEATVSRWISGKRRPDTGTIRAIEEVLKLEPGALHRRPTTAAGADLLAGLNPTQKQDVLAYIQFQKTKTRPQDKP